MADHLVGGLHCADALDFAAAFVLGALEPEEMTAVRQHLAGCPEAHAEFAELGSVVPALFETVDIVQPRPELRDRILAAARADTQRVIEMPRLADTQRSGWAANPFRRPLWAAMSIAAALALVALGAWNLQLRQQVDDLARYRNAVAVVIDQATAPGSQLAVLTRPDGIAGPAGFAAVSADGTDVSMVMRDLAPTSGTEVYEAWLLIGANAPLPIGSFSVDASGTAIFTTSARVSGDATGLTVALTREARPGATTPTLPIIAAGKAAAQAS